MNIKFTSILVVFLSLLGLIGVAGADIYVYRDPQGVLHFTNTPTHLGYRPMVGEATRESYGSYGSPNRFDHLIRSASDRYGVDAHLIRAVIKAESDFNAEARSPKGALGLMQLMPDTARLHNVNNAYDPSDNINGGVQHLRLLLGRYQGNLELVLAAYNAGVQAVEKYRGIPPFVETKEYVRRVLKFYQTYRGQGFGVARDHDRR